MKLIQFMDLVEEYLKITLVSQQEIYLRMEIGTWQMYVWVTKTCLQKLILNKKVNCSAIHLLHIIMNGRMRPNKSQIELIYIALFFVASHFRFLKTMKICLLIKEMCTQISINRLTILHLE
ncbi:transmembrane protein, putative (macronuclear) [Tetrahymena thermophila SB210]|uniref:Transmembrane protein, putative n=1 Tax=Tetrahymena thermophila (strain SB210) TaxID=312017 RepID=W7XIC7_TETTS|nr:transmembrane protein, putative [Tetrahymena thermophila SB210]EWS73184.1 transmembrane protein, putative [Tetrahymena thermophila SB210]|eukprot:XP_012654260.1 transmembrane protein, putative [Tetrahymena thermophila SB210]